MTKIAKVLKENTLIMLPEKKLEELRKLCSNYGQKQNIVNVTGVTYVTIVKILKTGKAQKGKVFKLLDYMKNAGQEQDSIFKEK